MPGIVSDPFKLIRKQKRGAYSEQITLAQSGSSRRDKQPVLPACSTLRGAALLKPRSLYICIKKPSSPGSRKEYTPWSHTPMFQEAL